MEGLFPFVGALLAVWFAACAVRTMPVEIIDLETLRASPGLSAPDRRMFDLVVAADDLVFRAKEQWDRGDESLARSYALMGQIKMKTALALMDAAQTKRRLAELDAQLAVADRERTALDGELAAVDEQNSVIARLRVMEAELADERRALDHLKNQAASEREKMAGQVAFEKRHVAALDAIRKADLALKAAETVESSRYATAKYGAASNMLQQAQKEFDGARWDEAIARATLSQAEATSAKLTARPVFEQAELTRNTRARDRALEAAASALAGIAMRLERDDDLQRLVLTLPTLFADQGGLILLPEGAKVLDGVAELLARFPTYQLQLSASALDRGKATNIGVVSLARSNATYWALVARGIDPRRMSICGKDSVESPAGRSNGPDLQGLRVELTILYHIFDS